MDDWLFVSLWGLGGAAISVMVEYVEAHRKGIAREMIADWKTGEGVLALGFKGVIGATVAFILISLIPAAVGAFIVGGSAVVAARQLLQTREETTDG